MKKYHILKSLIITLLFAGIYYYACYPALNISNWAFWAYIILISCVFLCCHTIFSAKVTISELFNK